MKEWGDVMSVGLVLEGGGTRGAYTAGVLDVFMEENIEFKSVYGISAGACNALSFISKQPGRNYDIFYQYIEDERYLSVTSLRKTRSIFGFDFIFGELWRDLLPFDYQTFYESPVKFYAGATDLDTGEAVFFSKDEDMRESFDAVRASSSLPMVAPVVHFKGYHLLDGGLACPIPIEKSIEDGNELNVIVLTRDISYQKSPRSGFPRSAIRVVYRDYPKLTDVMQVRSGVYNAQTAFCRMLEKTKKAVVIRPSSPVLVGAYEKDKEKLAALYRMGAEDARGKVEEIKAFLSKQNT